MNKRISPFGFDTPKIGGAVIKLTNRCNLHCRYCYMEHKQSDLSMQLLKKFLRETIPLGLYRIYLHGGEPLLRPLSFFSELVAFLKKEYPKKKFDINIMTNGTMLTPDLIRNLSKFNISIGISLDGPEKIHNLNRGGWSKTMEAIANLKKEKVNFGLLSVITKNTIKLIKPGDFLNFFVNNQLYYLAFTPCQIAGFISDKNTALTPKEYSDFMKGVFDAWCNLGRSDVVIREFEDIVTALVSSKTPHLCNFVGGAECSFQALLTSDGNIYPCDWYIEPKYCGGNIGHINSVTAITESKKKFMKCTGNNYHSFKKKKCMKCKWFLLCRGGCPLSITNKTNFHCQAYRPIYQYISNRLKEMGYKLQYFETIKKINNRKKYLLAG